MNEVTNYQAQLPDTLEDLTKFVLIGRAKLDAYKLKLQAVSKLTDAQAIRDQTMQDMQDVSIAIIAAEQRIGEIMLSIQKASGRPSENSSGQPEKLSKAEIASEQGYSRNQVSEYQRLAQNPEIVQKVIDDAVKNGEIVTRTQVMKEIRSAKAELERQLAEKNRKIFELENKKPEVKEIVKTVIPDDYERIKRDLTRLRNESIQWQKSYDAQRNSNNRYIKENADLKEENRKLKERTIAEQENMDLNGNAVTFSLKCRNFIEDVGGFLFIAERLVDLNEKERDLYVKAARAINDWSGILLNNIERNSK